MARVNLLYAACSKTGSSDESCFFFPKDSYLGVLMIFLQVQQVANLRRLGCAGAVVLRPAELCAENIHPGAPIRRPNQTPQSNARIQRPKIRIEFYLHKDRRPGGDRIVSTQRVVHEGGDEDRIVSTQRCRERGIGFSLHKES